MANDDIVTKKEYREWKKEMAEFASESWQRLTKRAADGLTRLAHQSYFPQK